jgi:hypothetical protein
MFPGAKFTIPNHQMPPAAYREVAANEPRLEGLTVSFLTTVDRGFSHTERQLGGIEIIGVDRLTDPDQIRIDDVLNYSADRYSCWEIAY